MVKFSIFLNRHGLVMTLMCILSLSTLKVKSSDENGDFFSKKKKKKNTRTVSVFK